MKHLVSVLVLSPLTLFQFFRSLSFSLSRADTRQELVWSSRCEQQVYRLGNVAFS